MENNLKVIICDDSMLIRKKFIGLLEKCKCKEILEAVNGQVVVELVKEHRPDLVFLDIVMPDKDGMEALKEIMEFDSNIKVVMASSAGTKDHLKRSLQLGAYDFIQKPVSLDAVASIIEKILKEREETAHV